VVFSQTLTIYNDGPSDASNIVVVVKTNVVNNVRAPIFTPSESTHVNSRDPVYHEWNIGKLANDESATLTLDYRVTPAAHAGSRVELAARVSRADQTHGALTSQASFSTFILARD
jgi:hypothetical protein